MDYDRTIPSGAVRSGDFSSRFDPPPDPPDQELLTVIDPSSKFELLNPLGRGSYGSVYQARLIETGDIVAVKIIPLTEPDEMDSIQKEIAMLRDCDHPNIVRYYGSWRAADALWIAMEYCAGGSVSDIMHACNAPLEETVISYICGETLAGLHYLHSLGRVHRDIKCGNILLTENGEVKLADFGVAAQLTSTLSKRNTFIGTPHWMAPEVIQASQYDGKVDIWALGITSIEMGEQYPPRWRVNPNRVIFMVVRDPPPQLAEKEKWTLAFQDFIAQCLNKDPRSRPTPHFLMQHKFIARDKAAALRVLVPLVHRAKAEYAALAQPTHLPGGTVSEEGYFSWRQQAGAMVAPAPAAAVAGTVLARPVSGGGAPSGTFIERSPSTVRAEVSGTMVVREEPSSSSALSGGGGGGSSILSPLPPRPSSAREASVLTPQSDTSGDYLAAVQSAAGGLFSDVELQSGGGWSPRDGGPSGGSPSEGAPASSTARKVHRMAERLYNLHSSGEVVPLPFLKATDAAPMALLGLHRSPAAGLRAPLRPRLRHFSPAKQQQQQQQHCESEEARLDWEGALEEILSDGQLEWEHTATNISNGNGAAENRLPPALADRVRGSPVLLSLAAALAAHQAALREQRELGASLVAQGPTKAKAEALADTLRAILCL